MRGIAYLVIAPSFSGHSCSTRSPAIVCEVPSTRTAQKWVVIPEYAVRYDTQPAPRALTHWGRVKVRSA
jgi:hypothetical protein